MKVPFLILMIVSSLTLTAQSAKDLVRKGNDLYSEGQYQEALQNYKRALEKDPNFLKGLYNEGDALYQVGEFEQAVSNFEQLTNLFDDPALKSNAFHNLGNAYLKAKQYDKSIEAYKKSLKIDPKAEDTRYNLAYAQAVKQQQDQQQQKKDEQEKEQKKEQKDQEEQQKQDNQKPNDQQDQQKQPDQQKQEPQKGQQPKPGELTQEQAEQILRALENDERRVQEKMHRQKAKSMNKRIEKDW